MGPCGVEMVLMVEYEGQRDVVSLLIGRDESGSGFTKQSWGSEGHPIFPLSSIFSSDVISGSSGCPGF